MEVRDLLSSNPEQKVQYFLYRPSVGEGNPADWKWILFLHKPSKTITSLKITSPEFNIYPTITEDKLYVKAGNTAWSYRIYNSQGQFLQSGTEKNDIDVSDFNRGIYILNIYNDNEKLLYSGRFIKK